jgi:hypothetical protein
MIAKPPAAAVAVSSQIVRFARQPSLTPTLRSSHVAKRLCENETVRLGAAQNSEQRSPASIERVPRVIRQQLRL